ncbi:MAG: ATP-binding protein, partial [Thermodesulfovibrionales bacterium]|nr:ATP-binding protein [Thermodesulfovibrionales bacterium]
LAQLTKGLSHNFNNILVGIMGYAGLIRLKLMQSDAKHIDINELIKYIDNIEKSADRASDLIKKMVLFSEHTSTDKEKVTIEEILNYLMDILKMAFPSNIVIETNITDSLPPLYADKGKLAQALINICINSKEAMPRGGTLKIEASLNKDNLMLIKICDTGCGMDEETQRRAIEPFFTTKDLINHFGFGLSIAHGIIKDHKGKIEIQSELNKGTCVSITLPPLSVEPS